MERRNENKFGLLSKRIERGLAILALANQIKEIEPNKWRVKSQSSGRSYVVTKKNGEWHCSCPDHHYRKIECKHIHSVKLKLAWDNSLELLDAYRENDEKNKVVCKYCGSSNVEKYGWRYNKNGKKQRYRCKDCGKRFVLDDGFSKSNYTPEIITQALDLYFKGLSLRKVADYFNQFYGYKMHHTTVLNWVRKYTMIIEAYIETLKPELSEIWHVDEMMIKTGGKFSWLWHAMDSETRFLIANLITDTRHIEDARNLFKNVKKQAKQRPKAIVTDGLQAYHKAFKKEFYAHYPPCYHIRLAKFTDKVNNNNIERLHGTIREREKIMRGMQSNETAKQIMDGFKIYYNFIRNHMGINNTPAKEANLDLELGRNKWKNLIKQSYASRIHHPTNQQ